MFSVLAVILALCLVGCTPATTSGPSTTKPAPSEPARLLIIDTDTGADDASALIMAARDPSVTILGVTVLAGNVSLDQGTRNALTALELAGCDAPVYKGADQKYDGKSIEPFSVFGADGMGDAGLVTARDKAQELDAADFIVQEVRRHPGEVEIVSLGPATNIANAIDRDPEAMRRVKAIWSMGTAGLGPGNASPVAEFNVYLDAPAYKRMLDFGVPVTVVGLDMCTGDAQLTDEQFAELEASGETGAFITKSFGEIRRQGKAAGEKAAFDCDAVAMTCVLQSDFVESSAKYHGSCLTQKGEAYGQVVLYKEGMTYDMTDTTDFDYNVTLVTDVKREEFFDRFVSAIS